jgi:hypothetical protein
VNQVLGRQAAGVVDRRLAPFVIGNHTDEAVADPAAFIADRQGRDALEPDPVGAQTEPRLPAGEPAIERGGGWGVVDNASQFR